MVPGAQGSAARRKTRVGSEALRVKERWGVGWYNKNSDIKGELCREQAALVGRRTTHGEDGIDEDKRRRRRG